MALNTLVLDDFSGGDSGRSRPAAGTAYDTFRAINVWGYDSGIGPRPPFQDLAPTGLPQQRLKTFHIVRGTDGFLYALFSFGNNAVYRLGGVGSGIGFSLAASNLGSLTNTPYDGASFGPDVYFVSTAGAGGKVDPVTGAVTNLTNMPAASSIVRYNQQAVVAITGTLGSLRWSDLNDFTTWPTDNQVPVGAAQTVCRLYVQRNNLIVPKLEGDIYSFTGVLGVNEVLRRVDVGVRHRFPLEAPGAIANQSNLWFCGVKEMGQFTGAQLFPVTRPDVPMKTGYDVTPWDSHVGSVAPLMEDDEFLVVGTMDKSDGSNLKQLWAHAHRPRDKWTRHLIPVTDYKATVGAGANSSRFTADAVRVNDSPHEGIAFVSTVSDTSANGGSAPQVFAFYSRQEHPLVPVGTVYGANYTVGTMNDGKSGAPVVATFQSAEVWHPTGGEYAVTGLLIDYSYNPAFTPFSTYNRFDVSVEALQNPGSAYVRRSNPVAFTPSGVGSNADGNPLVRGQARFQVGDQGAGQGFRIRLDDWRGIIVHRITVLLDENAPQL